MKLHLSGRLFLVAAVVGAVAVLAMGSLFVALGVRSVVAGPGADPAGPVPNPGHAWTAVEGHGVDGSAVYVNTDGGEALELRVDGDRALRLEPNATSPNVIEGYSGNSVTAGAVAATIGGGGMSAYTNRVTDDYGTVAGGRNNRAGDNAGTTADRPSATVGGGYNNTASGQYATVGGGRRNIASGDSATVGGGDNNTASGPYTTVGGGYYNTAYADYATVGGGAINTTRGSYATVGGGAGNEANGDFATVPGGYGNIAAGLYSFAAGYAAKANNQGCFVWSDSTDADVACNDVNQFIARASGGFTLYTSGDLSTGAYLAAGSGSWTDVSDRNLKANFTPVDGQEVLASLADIPITSWNYTTQDPAIRHMGPVAQDFSAAFGLGDSDTGISTVDADGVALAAIQGLYQLSQEQAARIQALEEENAGQQQRLDNLETRVTALEGGAPANSGSASLLSSAMPGGWLVLGGLLVGGLVLAQRRLAGGRR